MDPLGGGRPRGGKSYSAADKPLGFGTVWVAKRPRSRPGQWDRKRAGWRRRGVGRYLNGGSAPKGVTKGIWRSLPPPLPWHGLSNYILAPGNICLRCPSPCPRGYRGWKRRGIRIRDCSRALLLERRRRTQAMASRSSAGTAAVTPGFIRAVRRALARFAPSQRHCLFRSMPSGVSPVADGSAVLRHGSLSCLSGPQEAAR